MNLRGHPAEQVIINNTTRIMSEMTEEETRLFRAEMEELSFIREEWVDRLFILLRIAKVQNNMPFVGLRGLGYGTVVVPARRYVPIHENFIVARGCAAMIVGDEPARSDFDLYHLQHNGYKYAPCTRRFEAKKGNYQFPSYILGHDSVEYHGTKGKWAVGAAIITIDMLRRNCDISDHPLEEIRSEPMQRRCGSCGGKLIPLTRRWRCVFCKTYYPFPRKKVDR